jgi:hypothetical protein
MTLKRRAKSYQSPLVSTDRMGTRFKKNGKDAFT